jgi:hypothetical protein
MNTGLKLRLIIIIKHLGRESMKIFFLKKINLFNCNIIVNSEFYKKRDDLFIVKEN